MGSSGIKRERVAVLEAMCPEAAATATGHLQASGGRLDECGSTNIGNFLLPAKHATEAAGAPTMMLHTLGAMTKVALDCLGIAAASNTNDRPALS